MISVEQLKLLIHLKQYGVADKETCHLFVSDNALRPLLRYKYISYHDWVYRLLKKGAEETAHIQPLVTVNGNPGVIERALKTSRLAALFVKLGIQSAGVLRDNVFIPSNKWREIRKGVLSTARFNGMLIHNGIKLAVYDIGRGNMDWQAFAEGSLFYQKYGNYQNQPTGMLLVCDGDPIGIAEQILRYTISNRKALMKRTRLETDKKWSYSTGPIRLRPNYERVYITDTGGLAETLRMAECAKKFVDYFMEYLHGTDGQYGYDVDVHPMRYFVNPQGDLLKFAKCFDTVKSNVKYNEAVKASGKPAPQVDYHMILSQKYERIVKMYDLPFSYTIVKDSFIQEMLYGTDSEEH